MQFFLIVIFYIKDKSLLENHKNKNLKFCVTPGKSFHVFILSTHEKIHEN